MWERCPCPETHLEVRETHLLYLKNLTTIVFLHVFLSLTWVGLVRYLWSTMPPVRMGVGCVGVSHFSPRCPFAAGPRGLFAIVLGWT